MASRNPQKRTPSLANEQRQVRLQRIVFIIVSVILILSWVLALLVNV